jgi:mannose-1-phosphate guanylyltransferase / phosphomannomutase
MLDMQLVIVAGGQGTRLGEIARSIPKPMVAIGGRPNLEHQVLLARAHGFTSVLFLASHLAGRIEAHFGNGRRFGVDIAYCVEDPPLGTAGALRHGYALLRDRFLLLYGDVFVDCDLTRVWADHVQNRPLATLVVHPNDHPSDSDIVEADAEGWISAIHPKSRPADQYLPNTVNAGAAIIERRVIGEIPPGRHLDLASEVFPPLAREGRLRAYRSTEYFRDFGTPERLARTRCDFESGKAARCRLTSQRPAVFLERGRVINATAPHLSDRPQLELMPGAAESIRRLNEAGLLVIVAANQTAVAGGDDTRAMRRRLHNRMETLLGREHAWIDALYCRAHHPDDGGAEDDVERPRCHPKTGMFEQALRDWNLLLPGSYCLADSCRDVAAARRMGITAIGLKTAIGCHDGHAPNAADRLADDLPAAVDIILASNGSLPAREAVP